MALREVARPMTIVLLPENAPGLVVYDVLPLMYSLCTTYVPLMYRLCTFFVHLCTAHVPLAPNLTLPPLSVAAVRFTLPGPCQPGAHSRRPCDAREGWQRDLGVWGERVADAGQSRLAGNIWTRWKAVCPP